MKRIFILIVALAASQLFFGQQQDSALIYFNQYEFEKAILCINQIPSEQMQKEVLFIKGKSFAKLHKYNEAIEVFEELITQDSTNTQNYIELALCLEAQNQYKKAIPVYIQALGLSGNNAYIMQNLGACQYKAEKYGNAKNTYLIAFANDSTHYLAKQLARCYVKLNHPDTAIAYYEYALIKKPLDSYSTYRLANLYKDVDRLDDGATITGAYLRHDPDHRKICRLNASIHFLRKAYSLSAIQFAHCMELGDSSEYVYKYLGYSFYKLEKYPEAMQAMEKAFATDSLNVDLCHALGIACDMSYYRPEAIAYFKKCIELVTPAPDYFASIYKDMGDAFASNFDREEALDAFFKAHEYVPNDTFLVFKIASHYENLMKDKEKALLYYEKFLAMRPPTKNTSNQEQGKGIDVSYFDFAERKIADLKEDQFWNGDTKASTKQVKE